MTAVTDTAPAESAGSSSETISKTNGAPPPSAAESHGLFQFTAEDEWLLSIVDAEEVAPKKQRHFIDREYRMRATYDGWFQPQPNATGDLAPAVTALYSLKLGPNQLISSMEHHYVGQNYSAALELAEMYLKINRGGDLGDSNNTGDARPSSSSSKTKPQRKPLKETEVLEIAGRCLLKLNRAADAAEATRGLNLSKEPGHLLFRAEVLMRAGSAPGECVDRLRAYLAARPADPQAFVVLSGMLEACAAAAAKREEGGGNGAAVGYQWAQRAMKHARQLYERSRRPDTPVAQLQARNGLQRLDKDIERLGECINVEDAVADVAIGTEASKAFGSVFTQEQLDWIREVIFTESEVAGEEADEPEGGGVKGLSG
ncbi:uncharacterized protein EV422DRAFT_622367 [Fimicolochytrium jonesii]|uniref:uncharacterized protein n=1 Tax=Fimicolochytrium jonesii TaxID=1396493 RepID=UPI0022FE1880|nr:uncharacterized protein EV422DRAFT_622367 [Fimicolochytrium jonesii]KAI8817640.1 hypothetical protein EV422DRAFT_622367 [Fimicolochytrium jonesii]